MMKLSEQITQAEWQIDRLGKLIVRHEEGTEQHRRLKQDQGLWRCIIKSLEELQTAREDPSTLIGAQAKRIELMGRRVGRLQNRIHQQRQEMERHGIEPPAFNDDEEEPCQQISPLKLSANTPNS